MFRNLFEEVKANMPQGYLVKPVPEWKLAGTIEMALYRHAFERGFSRKAKQELPISYTRLPSSTHLCCLLVTLLDVLPVRLRRLLVAASVCLRMQPGMNM
jgi:hypothetical protein